MAIRAETDDQKRRARAEIAMRYDAAARAARQERDGGDFNYRHAELRRLFLHRGMTSDQAAVAIAEFGDLWAWSAVGLGEAVKLTFAERVALDIRSIQCCDRSPDEVRAYNREKKRERDRAYSKKRRRRAARMNNGTDARDLAVVVALDGRPWTSAAMLSNMLEMDPAFRRLDKSARRQAIYRALKRQSHMIEARRAVGEHDLPVLFIRLIP